MAVKGTVVGVDIGRYAVKAVWAQRSRTGFTVDRTETLRLPPGSGNPTTVMAPWIEKCGLQRWPCVLGFTGSQCMFQPLTLAPNDPRTDDQACAIEIVKFNEMASETMTYGSSPMAIHKDQRSMLLAMARMSLVDAFLRIARESGLNVIELVPNPVALFNAMEASVDKHDAPYLYLNIGSSATEIAIGGAAGMFFARAFSAGGQIFTDAIARAQSLPSGQAEELKLSSGSFAKAEGSVAAAIAPAAALWLQELNACLAVYRSLFPDPKHKPVKVVLAGGSAALRGLPEYVSASLNVETVAAESLPRLPVREKPSQFLTAAGLAMVGLGLGRHISLLPQRVKDELSFRRQKPFWIAAGGMAVLILAGSLIGGYRDFKRMEDHLNKRKMSLTRRQQLAGQIEQVIHQSDVIRSMAAPVRKMLGSGPVMRDAITVISRSKDADDWISLVVDSNHYFTPPFTSAVPERVWNVDPKIVKNMDTNNLAIQRIIVEGYTRRGNLKTVRQLIARLGKAEFVESADALNDDLVMPPAPGQKRPYLPGAQPFAMDVRVKRK